MRFRNKFYPTSDPYHVYIVKCSDGTFYTGITNDPERRLRQHNGEMWGGAKYTRNRGPVELVYIEKFQTKDLAAKREWEIKHNFTHEQKAELVINNTKADIFKAV